MKKTFPLFISFLLASTLLFGLFSVPVVGVVSDIVIEDFDSYAEGVHSGSNAYVAWQSDKGITSTTRYVSSPMSLEYPMNFAGHQYGYINLTSDTDISGFELWFNYESENTFAYTLVSLRYSNGTDIVRFKLSQVYTVDFEIYDYDTYVSLYSSNVEDTWYCVGFQGNHTIGNPDNYVYYYVKNSVGTVLASIEKRWISLNEYDEEQSLSNISLDVYDNSVGDGSGVWLDDFTVLTGGAIGTSETGCPDLSGYSSLGNGFLTGTSGITLYDKYIEIGSFYPIDATFHGLEVLFPWQQYNLDPDVTNYYCYFNGYLVGYATCFYPYQDKYVLQFNFSSPIIVDNDKIVIELYHSLSASSGAYWYLWVAPHPSTYPVQYDKGFFYHSIVTQLDGVLNGDFVERAMQWKAYYDTYTSGGENPQYENEVILLGFENNHPVWDIPFTYTRKTVFFLCYVNQTETPYKLHFYREGVEVGQTQTFPRMLNNFKETIGFTPLNDGNYSVAMKTQGGTDIVNHSFFVVNISEDYSIWTSPNPSIGSSDYTAYTYINDEFVYERYQIGFFQITENTNNIYNAFDSVLLSNTTVFGAFIFSHNNPFVNVHLLRIFGYIGNDIWMPVGSIYTHYIGSILGKQEYLSVSSNEVEIDEEFNIHGYHSYFTSFARVRLGEIPIYDCTGTNNFLFPFSIGTEGTYTLTLEVLLNGTWVLIDTEIVYVSVDIPEVTGDFDNIFSSIPLWIKGILGAIITLGFVFMPFIFLQYLEKINFKVDVPPVVYAISGGIGITLCTVIGLFGWEIMFFICVIAGLSVLVSYLWGKKGSSE